jgi:hypothetical protein
MIKLKATLWIRPRSRQHPGTAVDSSSCGSPGVLYVVVCAAPAASGVGEFVSLAQGAGWVVRVIATPMGERFIDADQLAGLTGDRVRTGFRMPDEPDELPQAGAVVVAPATFSTVNKWAAGITDTFAAGLLCELTGARVPILAVPLVKGELATPCRVRAKPGGAARDGSADPVRPTGSPTVPDVWLA